MNSATQTSIYEFHSTPHLYQGTEEPDLRLEIHKYSSDALQINMVNTNFSKQKNAIRKHIIFFVVSSCFYSWLHLSANFRLLYIEILLLLWILPLLWRLFSLVESESIIFCYDFGMHLQIESLIGKSNTFIASSNIHDVRINEVIENLDFRYLLIIRTKGRLFIKRPVIPVFKVFKPTCDCLSLVYKHLNEVMLKEM